MKDIKYYFDNDKNINEYVCKYARTMNVSVDEALKHLIVRITIGCMIKNNNALPPITEEGENNPPCQRIRPRDTDQTVTEMNKGYISIIEPF